jgi:hypothetical protein
MQFVIYRRTEDGDEYLTMEGGGWCSEASEAAKFTDMSQAHRIADRFPGDGATCSRAIVKVDRSQEVRIPKENFISAYFHCKECLKSKPADVSPQEWARLDVGYTILGIQVWCVRHKKNVFHMDLEGHKFKANLEG